jgi:probable F420-dependent oxidoreductase
MKFGVMIPSGHNGMTPASIRDFAVEAERIGLESVWHSDSLLRPTAQPIDFGGGLSITTPEQSARQYAPLETLSYLAAATSRIRLGTAVLAALFQNPASLARRLATVDQLSGGRLIAGLGQAWVPQEFEAAGIPPTRRGAGFAEHVEAMRAAWGPDPVRFDGRFYQIPEAQIGPKPVHPNGPDVLIGAASPAGLQRAGAWGLGLLPVMFGWDALRGQLAAYREAAAAAGHGELPVVLMVNGAVTEQPVDGADPLTGSVEQVAEQLPQAAELGVDHIVWNMLGAEPDAQLAALRSGLSAWSTS